MANIRVMQGRLLPPTEGRFQSFPRGRWLDEVASAREAGLDGIEWIFDTFGEGLNPIETAEGRQQLKQECLRHQTMVDSVCADYFLDRPLLRSEGVGRERLEHQLHDLVAAVGSLGMRYVVLPFVDASRITSESDAKEVVSIVSRALPNAERSHVELHLETALPPQQFADLLMRLDHPLVKVNYDSGNSASLGYRPEDEFLRYGARVGSVHIKDRVQGGGTVPLGNGAADFPAVFACLQKAEYRGDYVLQVARGQEGDEIGWTRQNVAWLKRRLAEHYLG